MLFSLYSMGQQGMGVGNNNPQEMLDVSGAVKIGNTTTTNPGTIRWNGTNFQGWDGTQWITFGAATSTDDQNLTGATLTGTSLEIEIEDGNSTTVDLSSLVDDADASTSNEIQTLSQTGTDVTLSNGGGTISVADNDNDGSNEIQTISISGNDISLSNSGGTVTVPVGTNLSDDDDDTKIQVEESADEDVIRFDTEGVQRVIINEAGNVGIGTNVNAPEHTLQVERTQASGLNIPLVVRNSGAVNFAGTGVGIGFNNHNASANSKTAIYNERVGNFGIGKLHFLLSNNSNGSLGAADEVTLAQSRVTFLSNGRVGIGTTAPTHLLHLEEDNDASIWIEADSDNTTETDNAFIKLTQDDEIVGSIFGHTGGNDIDPQQLPYTGTLSNALLIGTNTSHEVQIGTNSEVRMTVLDNGNVGVGTNSPAQSLEVNDGILVTGVFGSGDDVGVTGAGTRMFFNPKKAAFRAGYTDGTQWDHGNMGTYSVALGFGTIASGSSATALCRRTEALGDNSLSAGVLSEARGDESIAMGYGTVAVSHTEFAIGRYNTLYSGDDNNFVGTDRLFVVGNGNNSSSRSDALVMLKDGKTCFGGSYPDVQVHVARGSDASLSDGSGFFMIGDKDDKNIVMDDNEIMARNNGYTAPLYLQNDGGDAYVNGSMINTSDRNLKTDIENLQYGMNAIRSFRPVSYNWKNRKTENKVVGLIAQEVKEVTPEVVRYDAEYDRFGIEYTALIPVLIKAMQEQQDLIEQLIEENNLLKQRMDSFENE